jgi:MFS family permease
VRLASRLRPVDAVIGAHGLASFALGLVFPYTAIYLADLPRVGTAGVALFYASSGGANLAVALLLSAGVVRLPRVRLGVLGTLLWCAGYLVMPVVGSPATVMAAAVAIGAGQGCLLAAIIPIVNALVAADERRVVFARRYAVLNATLALGALTGGALTAVLPRSVIPSFFLANAVGILPLAVAMRMARRHMAADAGQQEEGDAVPAMPVVTLWKVALPAAMVQLAMYLFGFSQFEATAPLVSEKLMDMGLFTVSLLLFVNVVVISGAQRLVTRLLEKRTEIAGLRVAVTLWVAGYLVAGALAFGPHGARLAGLLTYAVLFGLGECAYSCSFHPWLIAMVPDRALTRANALVNSMMGIGNFAGPSIGVGLALSGNATVVWFGLAASCTVVTALAGLLSGGRRLVPAEAA